MGRWLRRWDSNPRSTGYEPVELTNYSTPRYVGRGALIRTRDNGFKAHCLNHLATPLYGAHGENRTHNNSLEGYSFTIKLHGHI